MDILWELWQQHRGKNIRWYLRTYYWNYYNCLRFLKAVFVILCALLGYYIGKSIDNKESLRDLLDKILPPGNR